MEQDPIARFQQSLLRASQSETFDASRVALATATQGGRPSVRFVLLKQVDERGFVFYTNFESRKGRELADNPQAAMAFHWSTTGEQIRVEGAVETVSDGEADAYFATRPRGSQIGAWASQQSAVISGRAELEERVASLEETYRERAIPRPSNWGGFRLIPSHIEFWHDRTCRLHDRHLYTRAAKGWDLTLLSP